MVSENKTITVKETVFNNQTKQNEIIERQYIVCGVCGHANPSTNAMCEMCSNFLDD